MKKRTLVNTTGLLCLLLFFGCLAALEGESVFVDEADALSDPSLINTRNRHEGEACGSTDNCADNLRCVRRQYGQLCASACTRDGDCDSDECRTALNDDQVGWCTLEEELNFSEDAHPPGSSPNPGSQPHPGSSPDPGPRVIPSAQSCGSSIEREQIRLLNEDRRREGLSALCCHTGLGDVARGHSQDMGERNFFDHDSPDGKTPWDRMEDGGVTNTSRAAENIASGQRTPAEVQKAWMDSPGHRHNILNPDLTYVGVGLYDRDGFLIWTQLFATFPNQPCNAADAP